MEKHRPTWIDLEAAREIGGFRTIPALQSFVRRFNQKHPECLIWTRWGKVESTTFDKAIEVDAEEHTPGLRVVTGLGASVSR